MQKLTAWKFHGATPVKTLALIQDGVGPPGTTILLVTRDLGYIAWVKCRRVSREVSASCGAGSYLQLLFSGDRGNRTDLSHGDTPLIFDSSANILLAHATSACHHRALREPRFPEVIIAKQFGRSSKLTIDHAFTCPILEYILSLGPSTD
jgi:hypothetical protein